MKIVCNTCKAIRIKNGVFEEKREEETKIEENPNESEGIGLDQLLLGKRQMSAPVKTPVKQENPTEQNDNQLSIMNYLSPKKQIKIQETQQSLINPINEPIIDQIINTNPQKSTTDLAHQRTTLPQKHSQPDRLQASSKNCTQLQLDMDIEHPKPNPAKLNAPLFSSLSDKENSTSPQQKTQAPQMLALIQKKPKSPIQSNLASNESGKQKSITDFFGPANFKQNAQIPLTEPITVVLQLPSKQTPSSASL